jgi:nitronate monooxygenase
MTPAELSAFLNRALETERAGARALVVFMDEHERQGEAWKTLRRVQADEAHNCALLGKLLDRDGVAHSHATGEFYAKAVAVQGRRARIEFLMRGLDWAVREFEQALPQIADAEAHALVSRMRDTHKQSIEACRGAASSLSA